MRYIIIMIKVENIKFNNGNDIHDLIRILVEYNLKYNFAFDKSLTNDIELCINFLLKMMITDEEKEINKIKKIHIQNMKKRIKLIIEKSIKLDKIIDDYHNPNHKYMIEKLKNMNSLF